MKDFLHVMAGAEPDILFAVLLLMLGCALMLVVQELVDVWTWLRAVWARIVGRQG